MEKYETIDVGDVIILLFRSSNLHTFSHFYGEMQHLVSFVSTFFEQQGRRWNESP